MRTGGAGGLGIGLIVVALASWAMLLTAPGERLETSLRVDEHETVWPNHEEVQEIAAAALRDAGDAEVRVPPDKSTVAVRAEASRDAQDLLDISIAVADLDRLDRIIGRPLAEIDAEIDAVDSALAAGEPDDGAGAEALARQLVELQAERSDRLVSQTRTRSRFVAMNNVKTAGTNPGLRSWLLPLIPAAAGAALLASVRRRE